MTAANWLSLKHQHHNASIQLNMVNSKVYPSELLSVQNQTSIASKHNTEIVNHLQIVKYTLWKREPSELWTETIPLSQSDSFKFGSFACPKQ